MHDHSPLIVWDISLDPSGYSRCGRDYILALHRSGYDVKHEKTLVSANLDGYGLSPEDQKIFQNLQNKPLTDHYVRIHHSVPDRFFLDSKADLNIGYTVAEADVIPQRWVERCNRMDAIFTASSFCKEVFLANGVQVPIYVVPHCHDLKKWNREIKPFNMVNNRYKHRFLFAGDITDRKGIYELLEVWNNLPKSDESSLTIKGYFNSFSEKDQKGLKQKILDLLKENVNPVFFYGHCLEDKYMPRFLKSFDYLISPHKGEGFGLIPFESIFVGVPPIVTAATGTLEFTDEENSLLVGTKGMEPVSEELCKINQNFEGSQIVKLDVDHLYFILESIVSDKLDFFISEESYKKFVSKFSYEAIASRMMSYIHEL